MSFKIETPDDLKAIAKYMTKAVKQDNKPPCNWNLRDLIVYFERDNDFDYKLRVPIWENMQAFTMPKTYKNIYNLLQKITDANINKDVSARKTATA